MEKASKRCYFRDWSFSKKEVSRIATKQYDLLSTNL